MESFKKFIITEKLTIDRWTDKHGIMYVKGVRNKPYPNSMLAKDNNGKYHILLFKTHKNRDLLPHFSENIDPSILKDPKKLIQYYHNVAKDGRIVRKYLPDLSANDFIEYLISKENVIKGIIEHLFPELHGMSLEKTMKVGDFEIIYQNEKSGKQIGELFTEACKLISKAGFAKICYGEVISTLNMGNVLADYSIPSDSIRVSNKARKGIDALETVIHELGHRLWYKFMNKDDYTRIRNQYISTKQSNDSVVSKLEINVGDVFDIPNLGKVEVTGTKYVRVLKYTLMPIGAQNLNTVISDAKRFIVDNDKNISLDNVKLLREYLKNFLLFKSQDKLIKKVLKNKKVPLDFLKDSFQRYSVLDLADVFTDKEILEIVQEAKELMGNASLGYSATAEQLEPFMTAKPGDKDPFKVSKYAMTDPEEFFSEVFSFALVHKDKTLVNWIDTFR